MRLVIQRVSSASVEVEGSICGSIGKGLMILVGIESGDETQDADYLAIKTAGLRIFSDEAGKMNRNILDVQGSVLLVSQFTLYADCRKGMRPSFDRAAKPGPARELYEYFVDRLRSLNLSVQTGIFQASMRVTLENDGPVTIICDSKG